MEGPTEHVVTRRRVLKYSGSVALAAVTGLASARRTLAAPAETRTVYSLDPTTCVTGHDGNLDCGACKACRGHANKLFSSALLANEHRAHRYCNCSVKSKSVSNGDYVGFFGPNSGPLHRDEFDPRRDRLFNSAGKK